MPKKDPIFWCASGIFILSLLLFAITKEQLWLFLMIVSYMLRPTLASLGLAKRYVDERQMNLHYRSSNIGFVVMLIASVVLAIKGGIYGKTTWEDFNMVIIIGLAAKALFNVILVKNFRETMPKIIISVGLLVALFASLDAGSFVGIIMSILPGLAIAGIGLLAKKFPRASGIVIIVAASLLIMLIMTVGLKNSKDLWGQIAVAAVIGIPLITAGVYLFKGDKKDAEVEPNSAA